MLKSAETQERTLDPRTNQLLLYNLAKEYFIFPKKLA